MVAGAAAAYRDFAPPARQTLLARTSPVSAPLVRSVHHIGRDVDSCIKDLTLREVIRDLRPAAGVRLHAHHVSGRDGLLQLPPARRGPVSEKRPRHLLCPRATARR